MLEPGCQYVLEDSYLVASQLVDGDLYSYTSQTLTLGWKLQIRRVLNHSCGAEEGRTAAG